MYAYMDTCSQSFVTHSHLEQLSDLSPPPSHPHAYHAVIHAEESAEDDDDDEGSDEGGKEEEEKEGIGGLESSAVLRSGRRPLQIEGDMVCI